MRGPVALAAVVVVMVVELELELHPARSPAAPMMAVTTDNPVRRQVNGSHRVRIADNTRSRSDVDALIAHDTDIP